MSVPRAFWASTFGLALTIGLASCARKTQEFGGRVVLPNVRLTGCSSPSCSLVWPDQPPAANAVYPQQVIIDVDKRSVRAVSAIYDDSVTMDEIKSSIDERYGRWAFAQNNDVNSRIKFWRVEPEKFAIGLTEEDNGRKRVYYLAFAPTAQVFKDITNAIVQNPGAFGAPADGQPAKVRGQAETQESKPSVRVKLPRYMTDISQGIPDELKLPDAPRTSREVTCFRAFNKKASMVDVVRKCGIPDEQQGSGIAIFIYKMADGSVVAVGTQNLKSLLYIDHITKQGGSELLKTDSAR